MAIESPRLTPAVVNRITDQLDALSVINERLTAYACGLPFEDNPADLSRRELHAYCLASGAILHALSDQIERLAEGAE